MNMKIKLRLSSIINLLICLIMVSYVGPFASYRGSILLVTLLGIFMIFSIFFRRDSISKKHLLIWQILFVYLLLNSLLNLPSSLLYILIFLVGYLFIERRLNEKDINYIFKFIKVVAVILSLSIFIQAYIPDIFYPFAKNWFFYSNQYDQVVYLGQYVKQFSGLFYEVSFSAVVLAMGIIICFMEIIVEKKRYLFNTILIIILYVMIMFTGKRSFILITPILVLILYFIHNVNHLNITKIMILISIIFLLIWKLPDIQLLIMKILEKNLTSGIQLSSREEFWELGINMFKDHPIIGNGLNSYDIFFNASGIRTVQYEFAGAHNSYIQLLSETGIIGFLFYITALISTVIKAVKYILFNKNTFNLLKQKNISISVAMLMLYMLYGLTGNVLHQPQQLIAICVFISIIENIIKNKNERIEN